MKISFAAPGIPKSGALVVGVEASGTLTPTARDVDALTSGAVVRAIAASRFTGAAGQSLEIVAPAGVANSRILLVGIGKGLDELGQQALGGRVLAHMDRVGETTAAVLISAGADDLADAAAQIAFGARLKSYRFDKYRTRESKDKKPSMRTLTLRLPGAAAARRAFAPLDKVADGVFLTRDLVSAPPNVLYPESFAQEARSLASLGIKVEVLNEKQMAKLGMGALLGVGQGSARESRIAIMQWNGAARSKRRIAFVGKGVTFDTGGI
jgi:leucyl aminopeptidase